MVEGRSAHELAPGRVVMLSNGGASSNVLFHAIQSRFPVSAVIVERPVPRSRLLRRRAARIGWTRAIDQAAFSILLAPLLRRLARHRLAELESRLHATEPIPGDRIVRVDSVNSDATLAELRRRAPDVVVISGTRIVGGEIIRGCGARFVNMHAGITPRYRGVHGGYWALAEGRPTSAGVTVHLVDEGIDTGAILGQARIDPTPDDSVVTYPLLQLEAGIPVLLDVLGAVLEFRLEPVPSLDASASKLWYHPGALAYVGRRILRGVR